MVALQINLTIVSDNCPTPITKGRSKTMSLQLMFTLDRIGANDRVSLDVEDAGDGSFEIIELHGFNNDFLAAFREKVDEENLLVHDGDSVELLWNLFQLLGKDDTSDTLRDEINLKCASLYDSIRLKRIGGIVPPYPIAADSNVQVEIIYTGSNSDGSETSTLWTGYVKYLAVYITPDPAR